MFNRLKLSLVPGLVAASMIAHRCTIAAMIHGNTSTAKK